jgi:hypothetical protein
VTLAQAVALTSPYLAVLLTIAGVPLLVKLLQLLDAKAASIQNATWRSLAEVSVHAVEQQMAAAPSAPVVAVPVVEVPAGPPSVLPH